MKLKPILYTSIFLISTNFVSADTAPSLNNTLSDRSFYDASSGKLHIPYIETNLPRLGNVSIDLFLSPHTDKEGRTLFALDLFNDLHSIPEPDFSYEGATGPAQWANLTTDYISCGMGKNQSPINIVDDISNSHNSISVDLSDISFNYFNTALTIENNGHTIEVVYDEGSSININGKSYELLQFHFHTPSEHTINGQHAPMEMHLVHKSEDDSLAVVGVLIIAGAENPALSDIVEHIPTLESEVETIANTFIDANNILPVERMEYRYSGSLTTPPCSEGVKWLVLQTPIEMSQAQIDAFSVVMGNNNRPVQSLNAREILSNSQSN